MKTNYYPSNLTTKLLARWPNSANNLPLSAELECFISVAYQASLLHEEGQAVAYYKRCYGTRWSQAELHAKGH